MEGLNGYYGSAHVLQGVSFKMDDDRVAVIGRNGMGKSTLCAALTGLLDKMDGSIRFGGRELMGTPAYKIAAAGIGFVPQGRRLFPSLSVDGTCAVVGRRSNGEGWTPKRIYELFPRLADASETQRPSFPAESSRCWPIARALLNPKLLIMDEPSRDLRWRWWRA